MATNIELQKVVESLQQEIERLKGDSLFGEKLYVTNARTVKIELDELKANLSNIFSNHMFEQPDIRLAGKVTAKATETATPEAPIPAAPTPAADWLEKVNAAIKEHGQ